MARRTRLLGAVIAMALLVVPTWGTAASAGSHTVVFLGTVLLGENEVPGPGDPDGLGFAGVKINTRGQACWGIGVRRIVAPTAAHVHEGDAGVAGPVVVTLSPPPEDGHTRGCTPVDPALAEAIAADPSHYYVNVHNADYPSGAVRGQLEPLTG